MLLRAATEHDSADLALLADAASRRVVSWAWNDQARAGQSSFEVGRDAIRSDPSSLIHHSNWAVAEYDGRIAGAINSYRLARPGAPGAGRSAAVVAPLADLKATVEGAWYVAAVAAFPEYRGRGVGSELLAHAAHEARAADVRELTLIVGSFNEPARRLYLRLGFAELARRASIAFPGSDVEGEWILMGKELG